MKNKHFLIGLELEDLAKEFELKFDEVTYWEDVINKEELINLNKDGIKEYAGRSHSLLVLLDLFRKSPFKFEDNKLKGCLKKHRLIWRVKPELRITNYDTPNWKTAGDDSKRTIPVEYSIYMRFMIEKF